MRPWPSDAFEWIRSGRQKFPSRADSNWKGISVSGLIPEKFESYAKILHTVEVNYQNIDAPLTERENEILNIPKCKELRSFVERLRVERLSARIRWKTLAQLLGVPFQTEICHEWFRATMDEPGCWPRFLVGPSEGYLNAEELPEVVSILSHFTDSQDCFFRFSEIAFIATAKQILFRGGLDELSQFLTEERYQLTPEYWWPSDHSWCLCSDYDLDFTFVGGPKELISTLLNNTTLEVLEVTTEARVDSFAPIPK
jgi:hypothetical protein